MTNRNKIKTITPKNKTQKQFLNAIVEYPVVLSVGTAGTGKTFLAAAQALENLSYSFVDKIVLVRPVVATEQLGFLPGDFKEKLDPYLLPLFDCLTQVSNTHYVEQLRETGKIEIAPLAFMRGRTFSNAFIILDEAQNTTVSQMRLFLTRFGENVRVVITGDTTQSDIKEENGLQWALDKLRLCPSVSIIEYKQKHVVRSALVADIIQYIDD
jgi:phosphate starvation-inducible PhoH-like protein